MELTLKSDIDVVLINQMGDDLMLAKAAWVSTQASLDKTMNDVEKLIPYLMKHRHGSPFEHGALTICVNAPIFVWREWHRHRIGMSYNEESARYKTLDPVFYVPSSDRPMFKVDNWKAGKPKFLTEDQQIAFLQEQNKSMTLEDAVDIVHNSFSTLSINLEVSYELAYKNYLQNLSLGFDPGLARDCLPVGIYSSCWVTMNPRSIMNFLSLRVHSEDSKFISYPLWEIDMAAREVEDIFKAYWPITHKAFVDNGRVAP